MGWGTSDWIGRFLRAEGSNKGEREALPEYHQPTYGDGVSFKSVLIVVLVMVALIVGAIVIFT